MSASCQKIDLPSWPRRDIFSFFSVLDQPFYSVCFRVDVTQRMRIPRRMVCPSITS